MSAAYNVYLESVEGHLGKLQATFQEFSNDTVHSDWLKWGVDAITSITQLADKLSKLNMILPVTIGLFTAFRSVGEHKYDVLPFSCQYGNLAA